jgi:hypothetical protein
MFEARPMRLIFCLLTFAFIPVTAPAAVASAQPAPLQQGQAASRSLATQGIQSLRPADPRAVEAFLAQHRRAKAALVLTAEQAADLDALARALQPRVVAAAGQGGNLLDAATSLVAQRAPALSRAEAAALAAYVVAEAAELLNAQARAPDAAPLLQEIQMSFNIQLLQTMQSENRSYTAVSNIMKTKHDTVKNSISNVR